MSNKHSYPITKKEQVTWMVGCTSFSNQWEAEKYQRQLIFEDFVHWPTTNGQIVAKFLADLSLVRRKKLIELLSEIEGD